MREEVARGLASRWALDADMTFLNHGSFGACPVAVLEAQRELQARLERQPVQFLLREYPARLEHARASLASFVGSDEESLAFVTNATQAVNAVLRSVWFGPDDDLLTTDHAYGACKQALGFISHQTGAKLITARVPFPLRDPQEVVEAVLEAVTPRTKLALIDHITSSTGVVFPIEALVRALEDRGVPVLVDGAHGPGMVPLALTRLGASWYVGNLHKWVCAPKGAAFLWARQDRRWDLRPLAIGHGAGMPTQRRSRFLQEFDWPGTFDPTAWLSVPTALECVGGMVEGGWPEVMRRNRALVLEARGRLCQALKVEAPSPAEMIGALAAVPLALRGDEGAWAPSGVFDTDPTQGALWERHRVEVPLFRWPEPGRRWLRVSAHLHNAPSDYDALIAALGASDLLPA